VIEDRYSAMTLEYYIEKAKSITQEISGDE
jgi:hypothetical protein